MGHAPSINHSSLFPGVITKVGLLISLTSGWCSAGAYLDSSDLTAETVAIIAVCGRICLWCFWLHADLHLHNVGPE